MQLQRKNFINNVNSNDIWDKKLDLKQTLDLLNTLENELNKYDYEIDNNFIMEGRRAGLKQDIEDRLLKNESNTKEIVSESLFNLWEFVGDEYTGSVITAAQELGLTPLEVDTMCSEYRNKGIICKQEKDIIIELINKIKEYILEKEF